MRTILLVIVFAAPVLLGGCAGGNMQGSSLLPGTSQAVHHFSDSVGAGPPSVHADGLIQRDSDSVGSGPPKTGVVVLQSADSVGNGPPTHPRKHTKMRDNSGDSVGSGPP
jgi:hypothetical protein